MARFAAEAAPTTESNAVLERLRLLRGECGAASIAAPCRAEPRPGSAPPPGTHALLRSLYQRRAERLALTPARAALETSATSTSLPGIELDLGLRLVEWSECPKQFGADPVRAAGSERLRFLDTETTGLAGGTGTIAFVVALADWRGSALRIRQLLLTRPSAEHTLWREFATWLAPGDELVSYNGRCFDAPLIATRFRLHRLANPLADLVHHDLLHRVRRKYRREWENCRLLTAERRLLGIERRDDLPGAEAPWAWRRFLETGATGPLTRVLLHNRQDLVSLALLAQRPELQSVRA